MASKAKAESSGPRATVGRRPIGLRASARRAPVPVGLVGAGKHGDRYLRHLVEDVPELRVRLLCRRDAASGRTQAEAMGARFVADFRELAVSPEIEAVIAVVPPSLNPEICRLAAGAGKAILVEKPLAATVAAGAAIRDAVRSAGVPALVAQTLRWNAVVRAVAAACERIAPIHQVVVSQRFEPSRLSWLDDPPVAGGGIVLHTGVHGFDLLRFLTGRDPRSAVAIAASVMTKRSEDVYSAAFAFDPPLVAAVSGSRATLARSGGIEVSGANGQIAADHVLGFARLLEPGRVSVLEVGSEVPTVRAALRTFAAMIRDGVPPPLSVDDGLWAVAMAEACYRSIATGRAATVSVDPRVAAVGRG